MVCWSKWILDPTLTLNRAQLGFRIKVGAECGNIFNVSSIELFVTKNTKITSLVALGTLTHHMQCHTNYKKKITTCAFKNSNRSVKWSI